MKKVSILSPDVQCIVSFLFDAEKWRAMKKIDNVVFWRIFFMGLFALWPNKIFALEYVYPICAINSNCVIVAHQDSFKQLHILTWNNQSQEYARLLPSFYNPLHIRLLEDHSGFSFIDNGLLKIKLFARRSPKTILIREPLRDISSLIWIASGTCCFQAFEKGTSGIYEIDLDGSVRKILVNKQIHYMFPQKVGTVLFCVSKSKAGAYSVVSVPYSYAALSEKDIVAAFQDQAIAFLFMENASEGYVIGYSDSAQENISFSFYQILQVANRWQKKQLFTFNLAKKFFLNTHDSLNERLIPFLPRKIGKRIYFVSENENRQIGSYYYDIEKESLEQCSDLLFFQSPKEKQLYPYDAILFPPIAIDEKVIHGSGFEVRANQGT